METTKLRKLMDKYKITNLIKIVILLVILFLLTKLFIPSFNITKSISNVISIDTPSNIYEGFETLGYSHYGNSLSLQEPNNKPAYAGNTCTFKFDGIYRIEALKLKFNNNINKSGLNNAVIPFSSKINGIYIQYLDGNGNLQYIRSSISGTPPNFLNTSDITTAMGNSNSLTSILSKGDLIDENNLAIYTSMIVVTVGDTSNAMDTYLDACGVGYISNFAFWGCTREMLSKKDFEHLAPTLSLRTFAYNNTNFDPTTIADTYAFSTTVDYLMYGLNIIYDFQQVDSNNNIVSKTDITVSNTTPQIAESTPSTTTVPLVTEQPTPGQTAITRPVAVGYTGTKKSVLKCGQTTDSPFKLSIMYNNGIYAGNNFNVNNTFIIRSDVYRIEESKSSFIIFPQSIIGNKINITVPRVTLLDSSGNYLKLVVKGIKGYGATPSQNDIATYQKTVNALLSSTQSDQNLEVCPSMDTLVSKQNQTQAICDNLEYQDRIKSEKARLEKNKQYLLKLQQQQKQIDQLNTVIQTLDNKRNARTKNADMARLLQYQQQKGTAVSVRDLANQRLQSQANNQLYMDVNINTDV